MTEAFSSAPSLQRTASQDVLALLDHALPLVLIIKLSGAWIYPSFIPSDAAPGLAVVNALSLAFCLYGTLRLLFTRAASLLFAEPAYLLVLALAAFGVATSVSPANSFGLVRTGVLFIGACVFIRHRFSPHHILRGFALTMGILLVLSMALALLTPLGTMGGYDAGRWRGVFNHKNTLGEGAALTLVVATGLYAIGTKTGSWMALVIILAAGCLVMSGSATALASAGAGLLVFALAWTLVRLRVRRQQGFWLLLVLLLGLVGTGLLLIAPLAEALGRDLTFTGRTEIWQQFIYFAQQRPWTGWGWATISTGDHMLPIIRQTLGLPYIQTPHSGYLSLLVELGIAGLVLFLVWLIHTVLSASYHAVSGRSGVAMIRLAVACALVVHSLFESTSGALPSLWLLLLFASNRRVVVRWQ